VMNELSSLILTNLFLTKRQRDPKISGE
jgi:hypothetical protein